MWVVFFWAMGWLRWTRAPPDWPKLEREWSVETAKQIVTAKPLPGKPNGAVTLYLLGWIEADDMEKMLTARIAYPDKKIDPNMVGVYPSYRLVNQGHKVLVAPDR